MEKLTPFTEIFQGLFLKVGMPLLVVSTFSVWLFVLIVIGMIFIASRFYKSNITSSQNMSNGLAQQVKGLQQQLDYASREEIKARAESERSAAARDKLLTSLSHEIRTPMNGILGMAILLEETALNPEQRDYIDTILQSGKILLNKVDEVMAVDMLDNSKINGAPGLLKQQAVDLKNCIEEVLETFAVKASENKLDLLYEIDAAVPMQVTGDNKCLQQVLINLVENVMATTEQQQVFIGVHLVKHEEMKMPFLVFEVTDKRIGDTAEITYQLVTGNLLKDYLLEEAHEDRGLGLTISKKLVKEMGGEIKTVGRAGATGENFIFSIPFSKTAQTADEAAGQNMKGLEGQQILIVNNNITAAGILKNKLEQWKLLPVIAFSGKRALEILSKETFSLVITDMHMPEMDGIELAKLLRVQYPLLPLLLLKPLNDERYKDHEEIFGEIAVLNKPVKQHVLFDNILSTLRQVKNGGKAKEISIKNLSASFAQQYPLRILVAEDNPVNQKWATKILNKMGYQPAVADNGHIALDMVGQETYDLILMDVQMPEMDGMEATKMIRVCLDKQPVVIAMTANVMHGDRLACMQAGMDDYISKPVELADLVNMLEKWALVIRERKLVH